jgi:pimeloyl-ACP methyl ester carboxylesterase
MTDHIFTLPDNRKLGYTLYGTGDGIPVFYFHGTPSSRLELLMLNAFNKYIDELCLKYNLQLIAIDRPGIGNSDFNPRGTFLSFAKDLASLAQKLSIASAKSLSWSGGGPYALSQAYHFPNLITRVDIITGFTRSFSEKEVFRNMTSNKYYFGAAKYIPWLLKPVMRQQGSSPGKKPLPRWLTKAPEPDHQLMKDHEERIIAFSRTTTMEAVKKGSKGVVYEAQRYFDKPGYNLKDIHQPVHFWWGTEDNVVQYIHAEAIKNQVPNSQLHIKEGEGHISIYINCIEEILKSISDTV